MARATKKKPSGNPAGENMRAEIIAQCANLFEKVGYHRASMQNLADEVGLGKPTLYHYFPSKAAILYEIHEIYISTLIEGLNRRKDESLVQRLKSAGTDLLTHIAEHPGYVRAFLDHYADLDDDMRAKIRVQRQAYFSHIVSIFKKGIAEGQFKKCDPEMTTYAFLGMFNWASKWYPNFAAKMSAEEACQHLSKPFFEGLLKSSP